MIKGWKLNPEWVRLMDEKKKERLATSSFGKMIAIDVTEFEKQRKKVKLRQGLRPENWL